MLILVATDRLNPKSRLSFGRERLFESQALQLGLREVDQMFC